MTGSNADDDPGGAAAILRSGPHRLQSEPAPWTPVSAATRGRGHQWEGRVHLSIGRAIYVGPVWDTSRHAHHALQLCVALNGDFRLWADDDRRSRTSTGVLVASNFMHQLDGGGSDLLLLYMEPETLVARRAKLTGVTELSREHVETLRRLAGRATADEFDERAALSLHEDAFSAVGVPIDSGEPLDPRVARAIGELSRLESLTISPADLAARVALSYSRFRHLFLEQVGMSCRRYILWLRLYRALEATSRGSSLTTAAHEIGFADAAHLSRTFRRMLGISPSLLVGSLSART